MHAAHVHAAHVRAPAAHVDSGIFVESFSLCLLLRSILPFPDPSFYGPDELYEKPEKEIKNKNKPAYYTIY